MPISRCLELLERFFRTILKKVFYILESIFKTHYLKKWSLLKPYSFDFHLIENNFSSNDHHSTQCNKSNHSKQSSSIDHHQKISFLSFQCFLFKKVLTFKDFVLFSFLELLFKMIPNFWCLLVIFDIANFVWSVRNIKKDLI